MMPMVYRSRLDEQKEEARYDYGKPGLSSNTSHFTANVWRLTTHVGFGVFRAKYKGESTMWVVGYFSPRGNQAGDFARNVLPRGSVYHGDDNMVRRAVDTVSPSGQHPRKAPAGRHAGEAPGAYVRVETAYADVKPLRSANGKFTFQVLPDRNIIVRQAERVIWNSGSRSADKPPFGAPFRLVLQKNGDLVGYDSSGRVFWSSETAKCGPPPYTLTMQDDGQCVLFDGRWKARWATDSRPITRK
ncbi:unnamed protein product [Ectocarpus sp. CCAP 1310/34]|nr:unnamed protein product [Ectocarpus sp. CCAP 1310/34]